MTRDHHVTDLVDVDTAANRRDNATSLAVELFRTVWAAVKTSGTRMSSASSPAC
jgi:hypothetical protein